MTKGNVLLIGASGDIGSAIARELDEAGFSLILHYNANEEGMNRLRPQLGKETILLELRADLRTEENVHILLSKMAFPVDHIVFASGAADYGMFQDVSYERMNEMMNLHVLAPWMITKHLLPEMIKKRTGNIVFITSVWGDIGASYEVLYSSVKGAQNSFVKALAKEVGASGLRVNAVSPGFIETKMNGHLEAADREQLFAEIPLGRPGTPEEVANAVGFLIGKKASYINGEILNVDGGW